MENIIEITVFQLFGKHQLNIA